MTDKQLSPEAQAVLDAAFSVYDCEALYSLTEGQHAGMIAAAALRAVANQCKIEWNYHPDYPETESVIIVSELLAIADELGALPND
jgi:hypothetical protein